MTAERLFPEERRQKILELLQLKPKILVSELADEFAVSQFTVRSDLDELERLGLVIRTHGGAMRPEQFADPSQSRLKPQKNDLLTISGDVSQDYQSHLARMSREKSAIGKKAAELVSPGDIISVDTGTTTLELIRHLDPDMAVTIITNDFRICALTEDRLPKAQVLFLGGFVKMGHHYTEGSHVNSALKHYHADKAFISCSGFTIDEGFMSEKPNQAPIKRGYLTCAKESFVMMDSTKLGHLSFAQFASTSEVKGIVTNEEPPLEMIEAIRAQNEKILIAVADPKSLD